MKIKFDLHVLMAEKRMQAKELADLTGISPMKISLLRHGKTLSIQIRDIGKICKALKCDPENLFVWTKD